MKEPASERFRNREYTSKIILLNLLSSCYITANGAEEAKYGQLALDLAEKLNWNKGIADAYNCLVANYFQIPGRAKSLEYFAAAIHTCEEMRDKRVLSATYRNLAGLYSRQSDCHMALKYLQKRLQIDQDAQDKLGQAVAHRDIWRNTVNTAARREQNSEGGKINIQRPPMKWQKIDLSGTSGARSPRRITG